MPTKKHRVRCYRCKRRLLEETCWRGTLYTCRQSEIPWARESPIVAYLCPRCEQKHGKRITDRVYFRHSKWKPPTYSKLPEGLSVIGKKVKYRKKKVNGSVAARSRMRDPRSGKFVSRAEFLRLYPLKPT